MPKRRCACRPIWVGALLMLQTGQSFVPQVTRSSHQTPLTGRKPTSGRAVCRSEALQQRASSRDDANELEAPKPLGSGPPGNGGGSGSDEGIFGGLSLWWRESGPEDVKVYGTSLVLALLFRTFVMEPRYIPSLSMFPTFEVGDQLAVEKVSHFFRPYTRTDVVVFHPPPEFNNYSARDINNEALIKRVVATAGDKVQVKNGALFVNDQQQDEQFVFEEAEYAFGPAYVPPGQVLVLGDNRNHSLDGHIWGFLPEENIIGRAVCKYWPLWRVGLVEH